MLSEIERFVNWVAPCTLCKKSLKTYDGSDIIRPLDLWRL
jgi:hypothetical protein